MDAVDLARLQFALTVGFHFLFPPISIGLSWLLVIVEYLGWKRGDLQWERAGRFFGKLFALTFAVGVATGVVMEFQFGTNWATYSRFVGDIFGAPLAAEGVFAFFLESGFLGLYLFGRNRVSKRTHWISILLVALGATLSAFWIIVANSWQQTPAGFIVNTDLGRAEMVDFVAAVFNPSTGVRYAHTVIGALITGAFFMAGISAWMHLRGQDTEVTGRTLKLAVVLGFVASILAIFPSGHMHAQQVAATQPEKFAANGGRCATRTSADRVVFGVVGQNPPQLHAAIEIPGLLSWMAFGDVNAEVKGIDAFPADEIPPLWLTFVSFHNMVVLGCTFLGLTALGVFLLGRGKLLQARWFQWAMVIASPLPLVANQFGWAAAEVGRQPWIVYKLLRTSDSVSVTVSTGELWFSLVLISAIYVLLLGLYLFLLRREVDHGVPALATKGVQ